MKSHSLWIGSALLLLLSSFMTLAWAQTIPTPARFWVQPRISEISDELAERMIRGGNYPSEPGLCPVTLADLRAVTLVHLNFQSGLQWGQVVVHHSVAREVADIFTDLYLENFAIHQLVPGYSDDQSLRMNNSSGFNCGPSARENHFASLKDYGLAIDLNPGVNPYIRPHSVLALEEFLSSLVAGTSTPELGAMAISDQLNFFCSSAPDKCIVLPASAVQSIHRDSSRTGQITRDSAVLRAFHGRGWSWGGNWPESREDEIRTDYQRFEKEMR